MQYIVRPSWYVASRRITEESIYRERHWHRRQFLTAMGRAAGVWAGAAWLAGCQQHPSKEELEAAGALAPPQPVTGPATAIYPAPRNPRFEYGRAETAQEAAAAYTNFYEFTGPSTKRSYLYVGNFQPTPWTVVVDGLCERPTTFDIDDLYRTFSFEERAYRHRCVETWAMCVPWTGFPLADLIRHVGPKASAKYVAFVTFGPNENGPLPAPPGDDSGRDWSKPMAPFMAADTTFPWPYTEGLTLAEATNELAFLATGIYGEPLPKQHGAPVRLVLPWKYGFKSIKSIVRITLTDQQPPTFWNTVLPREYDFQANVNPDVPHPRWSQKEEWMLGTLERFPTQIYNGYGEYVGGLYAAQG
jgi:sulfoxide reductase catalytic subunit YedY